MALLPSFTGKNLPESENPVELKKELVKKYRDKIANPFIADESGYIDEVIDPAVTRKKIISAFNALSNKWVKSRKKAWEYAIIGTGVQGTGRQAEGGKQQDQVLNTASLKHNYR